MIEGVRVTKLTEDEYWKTLDKIFEKKEMFLL
jgi:predicted DNA-binding ribbon-helix-helix protein